MFIRATAWLLVSALVISSVWPFTVFANTERMATYKVSDQVKIATKSKMELVEALILQTDEQKVLAFTLRLTNKEAAQISFVDYWIRVRTKSGTQFAVTLVDAEQAKTKVAANSTQDFRFYARLNASTKLDDLIFRVIRWNFKVKTFEQNVGEFRLPANYEMMTPDGAKRILRLKEVPLKTSIGAVSINKSYDSYFANIKFVVEHVGSKSLTLPAMTFSLRTSEGFIYPLTAQNIENTVIYPRTKKELALQGSIPLSIKPAGWELLITQLPEKSTLPVPLSFYALPQSVFAGLSQSNNGNLTTAQLANKSGSYEIRLLQAQRLPWEEQDIMTAELEVGTNQAGVLPVLELESYLLLDNTVKINAEMIRLDKTIAVTKQTPSQMIVSAKIPYTYEFEQMRLFISEKGQAETGQIEFKVTSDSLKIPELAKSALYQQKAIGKRAQYSLRDAYLFSGARSDMVYALVEAQNLEKRATQISKPVGYFRGKNETFVAAQSSAISQKSGPQGVVLLAYYATLPKGVERADVSLVLGTALTEGGLAETGSNPSSYAQAATMPLKHVESATTNLNSFKNLPLMQYRLTIRNPFAFIADSEALSFRFDYDLSKQNSYEQYPEPTRLLIEVDDGKRKFSKELSLEEGNDGLAVGNGITKLVTMPSVELGQSYWILPSYTVNVYEVFNGHRRLLATQAY
jgi:hypothetical protein